MAPALRPLSSFPKPFIVPCHRPLATPSVCLPQQPAKQAMHSVCGWLIDRNPKTALRVLMERPSYQSDKKMEYDEFSREFAGIWVCVLFTAPGDTTKDVVLRALLLCRKTGPVRFLVFFVR